MWQKLKEDGCWRKKAKRNKVKGCKVFEGMCSNQKIAIFWDLFFGINWYWGKSFCKHKVKYGPLTNVWSKWSFSGGYIIRKTSCHILCIILTNLYTSGPSKEVLCNSQNHLMFFLWYGGIKMWQKLKEDGFWRKKAKSNIVKR